MMFKNMDKGLKKIWLAVVFSIAAMVILGATAEFVFWAGGKYVAQKAAEEKKPSGGKCETSDVVVQDGNGNIAVQDCHGKTKTRMTQEEWENADKEYKERMRRPDPIEIDPADLHQIRFDSHRPAPYRDGGTAAQQEMISYAWSISRGDEQFITMIEAESRWRPWAVEKLDDGSNGNGFGLCQVDYRYWPEIHQNQQFRTDWKYQVRECYRLWRQDVTFYGAKRNHEMIARFWWKGNPNAKG